MIDSLKPCPFCGKKIIYGDPHRRAGGQVVGMTTLYFICESCHYALAFEDSRSQKRNIERWNTRADAVLAELEKK